MYPGAMPSREDIFKVLVTDVEGKGVGTDHFQINFEMPQKRVIHGA